ncbi:hypothetical protein KI387_026795, partial [Taxus chinensis]
IPTVPNEIDRTIMLSLLMNPQWLAKFLFVIAFEKRYNNTVINNNNINNQCSGALEERIVIAGLKQQTAEIGAVGELRCSARVINPLVRGNTSAHVVRKVAIHRAREKNVEIPEVIDTAPPVGAQEISIATTSQEIDAQVEVVDMEEEETVQTQAFADLLQGLTKDEGSDIPLLDNQPWKAPGMFGGLGMSVGRSFEGAHLFKNEHNFPSGVWQCPRQKQSFENIYKDIKSRCDLSQFAMKGLSNGFCKPFDTWNVSQKCQAIKAHDSLRRLQEVAWSKKSSRKYALLEKTTPEMEPQNERFQVSTFLSLLSISYIYCKLLILRSNGIFWVYLFVFHGDQMVEEASLLWRSMSSNKSHNLRDGPMLAKIRGLHSQILGCYFFVITLSSF